MVSQFIYKMLTRLKDLTVNYLLSAYVKLNSHCQNSNFLYSDKSSPISLAYIDGFYNQKDRLMTSTIPSLICLDIYDVKECLGEGTFAAVWSAVDLQTNKKVAIKQIYVQKAFLEQTRSQIKKMKLCKSDHVVKIVDSFYDSSEFYLNVVLELCEGSLRGVMNKKSAFSEQELVQFLTQIVSAFLQLDANKLMHLDFKPENVLVADREDKYFKICDFGCSQISNISRLSGYENSVFGTFNYLAPEVYLNSSVSKRRSSTDIWALGITLYEMVFKRLPFTKDKDELVIDRTLAEQYISKGNYQIDYEIDENGPSKVVQLIKKMLIADPMARVDWKTLKQELMKIFKVPEQSFINIKQVAANFIPQTETYLAVIKLMKENEYSEVLFWNQNISSLRELREVMTYYFYIICDQFRNTFEAKAKLLESVSARRVSQLLKQLQKERKTCKDKLKVFERNDFDYRETQLLSQLKQCLNSLTKESSLGQPLQILHCFCEQLREIVQKDGSFFADSSLFARTMKECQRQ